ncbi:response regulator transcription factor [Rhodopirellula sp. P2]|uniref:response regulator transcription factor n=1 Tax=Rhodopirellula sp. P2 TaxID=2127060 RepID=UPI002368CA3F|nr:response regulator [Rhodopirellula sp. P2]WDQ18874.1 response regulator [Rhodopirellula sp. P2]
MISPAWAGRYRINRCSSSHLRVLHFGRFLESVGCPEEITERPCQLMSNRLTIAVIDDDESIRTALRRLLQISGYSVMTFASAEAFLQETVTKDPDCLLLDIRLGGMTGLQLQQTLLKAERSIPTLFLTSHQDNSSRRTAMQAGAFDVLRKPIDAEVLLDSIRQALNRTQPITKPKRIG